MIRYLAARVVHGAALLVVVSVLAFAFAQLAPGDPYSELANDPRVSRQTVETLRARAGLDRPFAIRYAAWVGSVFRGDLGYSLTYAGPVAPLLVPRIRATLLLTITSTLLAWFIAIPFGIWNAAVRDTWLDGAARVLLALLLCIPDLVLAIALLVLAVETGWFPVGGMTSSENAGVADLLRHLVLPVTVLAAGMAPVLVRHVRASLVAAANAPFALNARAHGAGWWRLWFRHLLPAAVHPLVSLFGLSIGALLSGSLLVEVVMGWPGLGPLFLEAVMARDYAIVLATVLLSTSFLIAGNLVADLLLYRLDPRIRVR